MQRFLAFAILVASSLTFALAAKHPHRTPTPTLTAYPCAPGQHYDPPQPVYDAAGTVIGLVVNRLWIPTEHPAYTANMLGTPVDVRPC